MVGTPSDAFASDGLAHPTGSLHRARGTDGTQNSFKQHNKFFSETAAKSSRSSAQRRRSQPQATGASVVATSRPCRFLRAVTIHRETIHVEAYCTSFGCSLQRARP